MKKVATRRALSRAGSMPAPPSASRLPMTRALRVGVGCREQTRNVVGIVLPVPVEGDHTLGAAGQRLGEAQHERRALSASSRRAQNVGARRRGRGGAAVGRAVVHHDDRAVRDGPRHQAADGGGLVEDGDDRDVVAHAACPITMAVRQPPRAMPCTSAGAPSARAARVPAAARSAPSPPCWPKRGASDTGSRMPSASRSRSSQSSSAGSPLPEP